MASRLKVSVLGPLEVRLGERVLHLPAGRQRALLAILLLADGSVVPVDRIVDALWGDDPVASARNAAQTYVARLRRTLSSAGPALRTQPPGYLLRSGDVERDDVRFNDLLSRAEHRAAAHPDDALDLVEQALGLWRGPAWAEFADSFARGAALRLEERRGSARELRAELLLRLGRTAEALAAAESLVDERPHAEPPVLILAEALAAAGRVPDGLAALAAYRDRLRDELGLDPGPQVEATQGRLLRGELAAGAPSRSPTRQISRPRRRPTGHVRVNRLVGRDRLLARIRGVLEEKALVTLIGPGGVGKTRLAEEVVKPAVDQSLDGVWWIDLGALRGQAHVARAVAAAIGLISHPGGSPLDDIRDWAEDVRGVLVLDNCEHVLPAVAEIARAVLAVTKELRLLATSRERIGIDGEVVVSVPPLAVPPVGSRVQTDAVELFLDRAAAADADFSPSPDDLTTIGQICARLDGLPLAIEFAAARVRGLSVRDLADRLDARLDLLGSSRRDEEQRHRTLRDVIDWSYHLLDADEQAALRALGWFAGPFDLESAEVVLASPGSSSARAADLVARLVDRSMLHRTSDGGSTRYRLMESVQAYVRERLTEQDIESRDRHSRWVLDLVRRAETGLLGRHEAHWVGRLTDGLDEIRAVVYRAQAEGDPVLAAEISGRLWRFGSWRLRPEVLLWGSDLACDAASPHRCLARAVAAAGLWVEGDIEATYGRASQIALDADAPALARAVAHEICGDAYLGFSRPELSAVEYHRASEIFRQLGRPVDALLAGSGEALALAYAGADDPAARLVERVVERSLAAGNPTAIAFAKYVEGEVFADADPERAFAALEVASQVGREVSNDLVVGIAQTALVAIRGRHGDARAAFELYADVLDHWSRTGPEALLVTALRNLVVLLARTGRDVPAVELAATLAARAAGHPSFGPEAVRLQAAQEAASARLAAAEAARAAERARRRSVPEAAAVASQVIADALV